MHKITLSILLLLVTACSQLRPKVVNEDLEAVSCTLTVAKLGGDYTTLQAAAKVANPGDMVCVRAGTYKEYVWFARSGTATQRITYMAYPGEKVIFDGSNLAPDGNDSPSLFTVEGNYLTFRGLELSNSANSGLLNYEANYNRFQSLVLRDNYANGLNIYGSYNVVFNSVAHHNNGTGGFNSDGFKVFQGNNNTFRHNVSYANSDDGFDTWVSRNNVLEFNIAYSNGFGPNGNGDGVGFKLGGELDDGTRGGSNTVRFNAAYQNRSDGFNTNAGKNNRIYNNIACGNAGEFRSFGPGNNSFRNNLACDNTKVALLVNDPSSFNSWNLNINGVTFLSKDVNSSTFLRLPSNSRAINKGVNVGLTFAGSAPDLGAFEVGLPWPRKSRL
jgi:hypothetical protein